MHYLHSSHNPQFISHSKFLPSLPYSHALYFARILCSLSFNSSSYPPSSHHQFSPPFFALQPHPTNHSNSKPRSLLFYSLHRKRQLPKNAKKVIRRRHGNTARGKNNNQYKEGQQRSMESGKICKQQH